jgi:hypothetical protein
MSESIDNMRKQIETQKKLLLGYEKVLKLNEKELANADEIIKMYETIMSYSSEELKSAQETVKATDIVATISREELQSKMKDFEKFYPNIDLNAEKKESSDIEKIIVENKKRFELDSILDKISIVGVERLTKEELDFLKEQSKKQ